VEEELKVEPVVEVKAEQLVAEVKVEKHVSRSDFGSLKNKKYLMKLTETNEVNRLFKQKKGVSQW